MGNDGNFYGTTQGCGLGGDGTVFRVTPSGNLTTLVSFNYTNGLGPESALTLGNDGNFYGTTEYGVSADGTIFQLTTNGTLAALVSFNDINGKYPDAALTLGSDGNFYSTTYEGGASGYGTVFQVTTSGTLTTLVSFNGINGKYPEAALTLGSDGNFYSTTYGGGASGYGTVFRLSLPPFIRPLAVQLVSGNLQMKLTGILSSNFFVQYCTNLANFNWLNLLSVTNLSASPYSLTDPAGVGQSARFYRAVMQ